MAISERRRDLKRRRQRREKRLKGRLRIQERPPAKTGRPGEDEDPREGAAGEENEDSPK